MSLPEPNRKSSSRAVAARGRRARWCWPVGLALLAGGAACAFAFFTRPALATVRLFAYERTFANQGEAADFAASTTSTSAFARIQKKLPADVTPENFSGRCRVAVEAGQPVLRVSAIAPSASAAQALANTFASHVVQCGDDWVSKRTREVDKQISAAQKRLEELRKQLGGFDEALLLGDVKSLRQTLTEQANNKAATVKDLQAQLASINAEEKKTIAALAADKPALRQLQKELESALTRYTDEHPRVKELRASIIAVQKESAPKTNGGKSSPQRSNHPQLAELNARRSSVRDQSKKAESSEVKSRQALERFATNEIAFVRLQSEYNALGARRDDLIQSRVLVGSKGVEKWRRADRAEVSRVHEPERLRNYGLGGAFAGFTAGSLLLVAGRWRSRTIRHEAALEEATGLPVLASLPDLTTMTPTEQEYWAVETLQRLRSASGTARRGSFICGVVSATAGEGRSTWIDLLADAALRHGNRVLVIARPDLAASEELAQLPPNAVFAPQPGTESTESSSIAKYVMVADVANLNLQKHWERALATWQTEENSVVLIELPPANTADALLLSSAVPNVIWLSAANVAETRATEACVGSLQSTGCQLIGAVLNRSAAKTTRSRAPLLALLLGFLSLQVAGAAQETNGTPPVNGAAIATPHSPAHGTNGVKAPPLAPWQQKLTLGPGDVFDISLYGQADSARPGMAVGPDGRFSYLQALDIQADGLTVDELRAKLENILMKYHLAPRVVIVPTAYNSKKYYVFGNVNGRGAFPLNQPVTIVEAVARAKGFASGAGQGSFTQADLSQAFLVRRQPDGEFAREPVDFEALFQRGDLSQNQFLAPDDYMYFPPIGVEEVYVLGEVPGAGPLPMTPKMTVLTAIAGRGGFLDGAFRQRVLVIRGSLQRPETFVVDTAAILRAAAPDFPLKPKDIVYVSRKPWAKAEELLEAAASDFVRAVVVTYTGREIKPILR